MCPTNGLVTENPLRVEISTWSVEYVHFPRIRDNFQR